MLDFRIETFLAACRHMNFTAAAEELHITQPAVSQHIRFLEKKYGAELFVRDGKRLELTRAGEILKRTMITMENDQRAMEKRMRESGNAVRTLTMGVTMTIGEYAVTGPLARYLNLHPDVNVCLRFSNTDRLLEAIRAGEMDLALSEGYIRSEEFDTELFRRERYIPVCAAGHALPAGKQKLKDLLGERLILREKGSGSRKILERNLAARNLKISDFIHYAEVENIHTMVSLLVRDCGIAFLYEAAVEQEIRQGLLKEIRLEDFSMDHEFLFLWNKGSVFSDELKKLCEEWIQLDKDASGGR